MGSVARRGRTWQGRMRPVGAPASVNQSQRWWEKAGWIRIGYGGVDHDRERSREYPR
jgi:hypothetical protein